MAAGSPARRRRLRFDPDCLSARLSSSSVDFLLGVFAAQVQQTDPVFSQEGSRSGDHCADTGEGNHQTDERNHYSGPLLECELTEAAELKTGD